VLWLFFFKVLQRYGVFSAKTNFFLCLKTQKPIAQVKNEVFLKKKASFCSLYMIFLLSLHKKNKT